MVKKINKNKSGKYRIVTIVVILIIIMLTFIMAYAPPAGTITGSSVANAITGYSVFNIPPSASKKGFVLATGMQVAGDDTVVSIKSEEELVGDNFFLRKITLINNQEVYESILYPGYIYTRVGDVIGEIREEIVNDQGITYQTVLLYDPASIEASTLSQATATGAGSSPTSTIGGSSATSSSQSSSQQQPSYLPLLNQQLKINGVSIQTFTVGSITGAKKLFDVNGLIIGFQSQSNPDKVYNDKGEEIGVFNTADQVTLTQQPITGNVAIETPQREKEEKTKDKKDDALAQSPQQFTQQQTEDKTKIDAIIAADTALNGYTYSPQGSLISNNGFVTKDGTVVVKIGNDYIMQSSAGGILQGPTYMVVKVDLRTGEIAPNSGTIATLTQEQRIQYSQQAQAIQTARQTIRNKHLTHEENIAVQQQYQRTQNAFTGRIAGYLSNLLAKSPAYKKMFEVPARICQHAYGLDYEKSDSWMRVPYNATAYELGQQMIANARTVIITGEKEEITPTLLRYAYSLRMLGDKSVEWETYLYNSCTRKDTKNRVYDHGALSAGQHFYFHYAGSQGDMVFNCEQEECVYDQACLKFADEDQPYCVDLVNGVGFTTVPANQYGCG